MTRTIRVGALALACLVATACAGTKAPPTFDTASARLSTESAYDASLIGLEQTFKAGTLNGSAVADARASLLGSYAVLIAGRASFAAAGLTPSPALVTTQRMVDVDYSRVMSELTIN